VSGLQVPGLASTSSFGSSGLFDGLTHVRFSFDRTSLHRMHSALAAVAEQQLRPHACWLPPGDSRTAGAAGAANSTGGSSASGGTHGAGALLPDEQHQRVQLLQPTADAVAQASSVLQERGSQQLNVEQRHAVAAVLCGAGRALPYALFGPPGESAGGCEAVLAV